MLLIVFLRASAVSAIQSGVCEHPDTYAANASIAEADTLRALVIFAKFPDGEDVKPNGNTIPECTDCGSGYGWSDAATAPPAWADSLIEDTTSPTIPGSLTHFFHLWSDGKHVLRGVPLDTVIVVDSTLAYFDATYGSNIEETMAANRRVLQLVDGLNSHVNFSNFDLDGDNFVDYIFINWRSTRTFDTAFRSVNGGVSWLIADGDTLTLDGKKVVRETGATISSTITFNRPDTTLVRHRWQYAATAIHEYGHDLTALAGHGNAHFRSVSRYGIMQGNSFPGCFMMEGYLRYELGWINPLVIDPPDATPFDTTFTLSADYTDHDDTFAIVQPREDIPGGRQYFLLEARAQDMEGQAYNTPQPAEEEDCCERTLHVGDGLLITHITEDGTENTEPELLQENVPLIDIEVATGMFDLGTDAPDAIEGKDRINPDNFDLGGESAQPKDLFQDGSGLTSIFAPFTNPSTALYRNDGFTNRLWQDRYSGISIYNIKWNAGHDSIHVSVRYEGLTSTTKADTLKADMKWQGLVQVLGDVYVASGKKLEIAPGATVVAAAHQDLRNGGADTTKVELIVRGHKIAEGSAETGILFTSSRDSEFVHFGSGGLNTEGEDDPAAAGDWYGSRLLNGTVSPIANELSYDTFRFGTYAVSVDTSSGNLYNCTFTSNDSADVYLSKDTTIPDGKQWSLLAPTKVLVKSGVGDGIDLNAYGDLMTNRPIGAAGTDSVVFTTLEESEETGDDWKGITVWELAIGQIEDASIGFASDPIYFSGAATARVWNSTIHHYANTAIVDLASNAWVKESKILHDDAMTFEPDRIGIHTYASGKARVEDNEVNWHEHFGILSEFSSSICNAAVPAETLRVLLNTVTGNDEEDDDNANGKGIGLVYSCAKRYAELSQNVVHDWGENGLWLEHCGAGLVNCNNLADNRRGIESRGTFIGSSNNVRLLENVLTSSYDTNLYTAEASNLKINHTGSIPPVAGRNIFTPDSTGSNLGFNITMNDSSATATLNARRNRWRRYDGSGTTDQTFINSRINGTYAAYVLADTVLTSDPTICGQGAPEAFISPGEVAMDEGSSGANSARSGDPSIPDALRFVGIAPNPIVSGAEIVYEVPANAAGTLDLSVFDVTGRLVKTLVHGQPVPGRFRATWSGEDCSGARVSAGVYFLRMKSEGFSNTKKVVLAR